MTNVCRPGFARLAVRAALIATTLLAQGCTSMMWGSNGQTSARLLSENTTTLRMTLRADASSNRLVLTSSDPESAGSWLLTPTEGAESAMEFLAESALLRLTNCVVDAHWSIDRDKEAIVDDRATLELIGTLPADRWQTPAEWHSLPAAVQRELQLDRTGGFSVERLVRLNEPLRECAHLLQTLGPLDGKQTRVQSFVFVQKGQAIHQLGNSAGDFASMSLPDRMSRLAGVEALVRVGGDNPRKVLRLRCDLMLLHHELGGQGTQLTHRSAWRIKPWSSPPPQGSSLMESDVRLSRSVYYQGPGWDLSTWQKVALTPATVCVDVTAVAGGIALSPVAMVVFAVWAYAKSDKKNE